MWDQIDPRKVLPTILIVIDVGAAIVYGWKDGFIGAWRQEVYWLSAAALTFAVTY